MLCKIADLIVEIPEAGGLPPRCRAYLTDPAEPDIIIREERYQKREWSGFKPEEIAYMGSGCVFYTDLMSFNGTMLHSSAIAYEGKAYLFSGPSGVGKSTHTRLWQQTFGDAVQVFNDDKPALRYLDGQWFAYGTPWCGKDGINQNKKVPLAGICFLKQGPQNRIRRMEAKEAIGYILSQSLRNIQSETRMDLLLGLVDKLVRQIPIYELENNATPESARLSYETLRQGAK